MPIIPSEDINYIRSNANIVDIISSYINLEPKGKNYFGLCPFHDDNTPSMSVSPEKQIFTCFVCGTSGNVFSFVQNYENVEFPEAVKIVADKIGYNLKYDTKASKKNLDYYEAMDFANKFYINNLKSELGFQARKYLADRKITENIIKEFGIGVALNDNNLSKALTSKKYPEKLLIDLGLANKNDRLYDVFRNRITFPINNAQGEVVGFSARIYNTEDTSKYINSKETIIFKKGHILFNYDKAKNEVSKTKTIILVEGQMDAIRIYSSGIKNVVATMGTALTKEHITLIKKLNCKVILMMDNDEAGEKTTLTSGEALIETKLEVSVVRLSGEKDPDDYLVKNGIEAFKNLLKNPMTFFDYKVNFLKKNRNLNKADELAAYINNIISELNKSQDDILREVTINNLVNEFGIDKKLLISKLTKIAPINEIKIMPKPKLKLNKYNRICEALLYILMNDIKYIKTYEKKLGYIPNKNYNQIANDILAFYKLNKTFNIADFISFEQRSAHYETVLRIISDYEEKINLDDFDNYLVQIKKWIKEEQITSLKEQLKNATDINEKGRINDLIIKLKKESEE